MQGKSIFAYILFETSPSPPPPSSYKSQLVIPHRETPCLEFFRAAKEGLDVLDAFSCLLDGGPHALRKKYI
jgi:hypothetical protein